MTREEAKRFLTAKLDCKERYTSGCDYDDCEECSLCYEKGNMGKQKEALRVAIKALEQEPCDDAISRQAVLDINASHHGQMPNHINYQIWEEVKDLPSIQPKPKVGHWINKYDGAQYYVCSRCGEVCCCMGNFCPECGIRMENAE